MLPELLKTFKDTLTKYFDRKYYNTISIILYVLFLIPGIAIGVYFNYIIITYLGLFKFTGYMIAIIICCASCACLDYSLKNKQ